MPTVIDGTTGINKVQAAAVADKANLAGSATQAFSATTAAPGTNTTQVATTEFVHNEITGRNRIINGLCQIDQRNSGAAQTITAGAALAYTIDRSYAYCTGASITGQQLVANGRSTYRFTGAASNTGVGWGQRIEAQNSYDLAGTFASLRINLASTSLTSITWKAYYANTADTFGTLITPTRTQFATGTFDVSATEGVKIQEGITVPAAAYTGIEVEFTGGALLAGQTLTYGDVQFEPGLICHELERPHVDRVLLGCLRYYERMGGASLAIFTQGYAGTSGYYGKILTFLAKKRAVPVVTPFGSWALTNTTISSFDSPTTTGVRHLLQATAAGALSSATVDSTTHIEIKAEL